MGVDIDGYRDVLGMWAGPEGGEDAKQWMTMLTDLRNRGVADVCIVCCDGVKGLPDAINAIWPRATVQSCVVHLIRSSLRYASKKDWAAISASLKPIYHAPNPTTARERFDDFAAQWGGKYPARVAMWDRSWAEFIPFLVFPQGIRRLIYTTNGIVIWSFGGVVLDVCDGRLGSRDLPVGRGYLQSSSRRGFGRFDVCSAGDGLRYAA